MAPGKVPIQFAGISVTSQVFHLTPLSFAIVNLKPLLPGHVLVCPRRKVVRLAELSPNEIVDLFQTVQRVGGVVERVYKCSSLNIAIQDGLAAGQSVPHLHTHIIPRGTKDLDNQGGSDKIYQLLESEDGNLGRHLAYRAQSLHKFPVPDESARKARTEAEMTEEAEMLATEMAANLDAA